MKIEQLTLENITVETVLSMTGKQLSEFAKTNNFVVVFTPGDKIQILPAELTPWGNKSPEIAL